MPLKRPPRAPADAITERVRRAILLSAERIGVTANVLLACHGQAEHIASPADLVEDVEERYALPASSLAKQVNERLTQIAQRAGRSGRIPQWLYDEHAPQCILLSLPDTEFLTVLEHVLDVGYRDNVLDAQMASELLQAADGALQAHGTPYRRDPDNWSSFTWVGDPDQRALTVAPALHALADPRLSGAHAEFAESLRKRRRGASKDLEDAVDEAAKAVESILQVLHDEHRVKPPRNQQISSLFNSLVTANVLPGYVDHLVVAAAGPRNHMAAHGQGATVREVPEELAEASIAAAATAITFLAHYLP